MWVDHGKCIKALLIKDVKVFLKNFIIKLFKMFNAISYSYPLPKVVSLWRHASWIIIFFIFYCFLPLFHSTPSSPSTTVSCSNHKKWLILNFLLSGALHKHSKRHKSSAFTIIRLEIILTFLHIKSINWQWMI